MLRSVLLMLSATWAILQGDYYTFAVCFFLFFIYFFCITQSYTAPAFGDIHSFLIQILWVMFYCHLHSIPSSHVISISEVSPGRVSEGALSSVNRRGFPWIMNGSSLLLNPGKWVTGISTCSWRALWVVTSGFAGWPRLSFLERYLRLACA